MCVCVRERERERERVGERDGFWKRDSSRLTDRKRANTLKRKHIAHCIINVYVLAGPH